MLAADFFHVDYKEQYVGPAITKLADFFTSNLAAVDTTPAQAASA